jgi:Stage II sporulation protein E (SpoIIE)/NACHT domain
MDNQIQLLRVVVASPGDVPAERDAVSSVVEEINRSIGADRRVRLEVNRWETDTHPGFHPDGPQGLIDPLLRIEDSDLLIGIFWKRFGTPTKNASSGTEHEIRFAIDSWRKNGRPQVFIYFNDEKATPRSAREALQWAQVLQFRDSFPSEGLWTLYAGVSDFERLLRRHITNYLRSLFPAERSERKADDVIEGEEGGDYFGVQKYILEELGRNYAAPVDARAVVEQFLKAHRCGYLFIHGAPGQGKTSFCADLIRRHGSVHHFVGISGGRDDVRLILRSLLSQIVASLQIKPRIPETLPELSKLWNEMILLSGRRAKTLVVIDGLDELPDEQVDNLRFLLQERLPQGVFFTVALRPGRLLEALRDQASAVPQLTYELGPLDPKDMDRLIREEVPAITERVLAQIKAATLGNPLYIRSLTNELQTHPDLELSNIPPTLEGFFRRSTRFALEPDGNGVKSVLAILAVARKALSAAEMGQITGIPPREIHEVLEYTLRPFLTEIKGSYVFYHRSFLEFVMNKLLYPQELLSAHAQTATWLRGLPNENDYRWQFLSHHLLQSGNYEALKREITVPFLIEKSRRYGYAVLSDIENAVQAMLATADPAAVESSVNLVKEVSDAVGEQIIREASRSLSRNPRPREDYDLAFLLQRKTAVSGLDLHVTSIAGADVSADFYEIVPTENGCIAAIGDAPGTGLRSSFVGRFLSRLVRTRSASETSPQVLLESINSSLSTFDYFERISMQCISINLKEGILTISNAGHPALAHFSRRRGKCDPLQVPGDLLHDSTRQTRRLSDYENYLGEIDSGDVIVMVTDGLIESQWMDGSAYGYKFNRIVEQNAGQPARQIGEAILTDWRTASDAREYRDDVLVVVLSVGDRSSYLADAAEQV